MGRERRERTFDVEATGSESSRKRQRLWKGVYFDFIDCESETRTSRTTNNEK
jgi:hypothetical protein